MNKQHAYAGVIGFGLSGELAVSAISSEMVMNHVELQSKCLTHDILIVVIGCDYITEFDEIELESMLLGSEMTILLVLNGQTKVEVPMKIIVDFDSVIDVRYLVTPAFPEPPIQFSPLIVLINMLTIYDHGDNKLYGLIAVDFNDIATILGKFTQINFTNYGCFYSFCEKAGNEYIALDSLINKLSDLSDSSHSISLMTLVGKHDASEKSVVEIFTDTHDTLVSKIGAAPGMINSFIARYPSIQSDTSSIGILVIDS